MPPLRLLDPTRREEAVTATNNALQIRDMVTTKALDQFEPGSLPTAAILVIETVNGEGPALQFFRSDGMTPWHAIGLMRSVLAKVETDDLTGWYCEDDD